MNRRLPTRDYLRAHLPDVLYGLVVLGAVLNRVYRLLDVPHTLWVAEAWFSLTARDLVQVIDYIPSERPGLGVGDSPMQVYLASVVRLLGFRNRIRATG
jgi:hypothetical protein